MRSLYSTYASNLRIIRRVTMVDLFVYHFVAYNGKTDATGIRIVSVEEATEK